ncbi:MAG: hypothetical protein D6769_03235 [Methanobacteriota archaeon]|nr:MAG: hypothetical protein D6769_03235 [Euryarchaeota archaeon]
MRNRRFTNSTAKNSNRDSGGLSFKKAKEEVERLLPHARISIQFPKALEDIRGEWRERLVKALEKLHKRVGEDELRDLHVIFDNPRWTTGIAEMIAQINGWEIPHKSIAKFATLLVKLSQKNNFKRSWLWDNVLPLTIKIKEDLEDRLLDEIKYVEAEEDDEWDSAYYIVGCKPCVNIVDMNKKLIERLGNYIDVMIAIVESVDFQLGKLNRRNVDALYKLMYYYIPYFKNWGECEYYDNRHLQDIYDELEGLRMKGIEFDPSDYISGPSYEEIMLGASRKTLEDFAFKSIYGMLSTEDMGIDAVVAILLPTTKALSNILDGIYLEYGLDEEEHVKRTEDFFYSIYGYIDYGADIRLLNFIKRALEKVEKLHVERQQTALDSVLSFMNIIGEIVLNESHEYLTEESMEWRREESKGTEYLEKIEAQYALETYLREKDLIDYNNFIAYMEEEERKHGTLKAIGNFLELYKPK